MVFPSKEMLNIQFRFYLPCEGWTKFLKCFFQRFYGLHVQECFRILEFSRLVHVPLEEFVFPNIFPPLLDFKIKPWGRTLCHWCVQRFNKLTWPQIYCWRYKLWKGGVIASSVIEHQGNVITETSSLERIKSLLWLPVSIRYSSRSKMSKWVQVASFLYFLKTLLYIYFWKFSPFLMHLSKWRSALWYL